MTDGVVDRRKFLEILGGAGIFASCPSSAKSVEVRRLCGFNLTEKLMASREKKFDLAKLGLISDFGFNFIRVPLDYRCWTPDDRRRQEIDERALNEVDELCDAAQKYNLHVNLALHRAPGYCVNLPRERDSLWTDKEALSDFIFQWAMLADRYKSLDENRLSFNILNEPNGNVSAAQYAPVMRAACNVVREKRERRNLFLDGLKWGQIPLEDEFFFTQRVVQSARGYLPLQFTHFGAEWIKPQLQRDPIWPLLDNAGNLWDSSSFRSRIFDAWIAAEKKGARVHVGEWGVFNKTPHDATLKYMEDCLIFWKEQRWGWALWQFDGAFGIIDSRRADVSYKPINGASLDSKMLALLQKYA